MQAGLVGVLVLALCMTLVSITGCHESPRPIGIRMRKVSQFEDELKRYQAFPEPKAIAISGDVQGIYSMGYSSGAPSRADAMREALEDCEERRAIRGIEGACVLYAVNDEVISLDESHTVPE